MTKRHLTAEEWAAARRRWEGCQADGFDWLRREVVVAFDIQVSRQGIAKAAAKGAWAKGGEPSAPLAVVAQPGDVVAQPSEVVAQPGRLVAQPDRPRRVKAEPVDLPDGEKPEGYAGTGRPSKYRPEYDQLIIDYFNVKPTREVEVQGFGGTTKIQVLPNPPPMLVNFAQDLGLSVETIGRWATEQGDDGRPRYPSFADSYTRARQLLEAMLVMGAALGVYDSRVTQFVLKNWYGWRDQPDKDVTVAPVSREVLETKYIAVMAEARERMRVMLEERARLRLEEEQGG